ncbi:MAG: discoidin domain-containing protein [Candidatus Hydrogenedentes bacterium]|nr:discoidin domain-containing protein [Candidatus Hydrogenedentota bacterium]
MSRRAVITLCFLCAIGNADEAISIGLGQADDQTIEPSATLTYQTAPMTTGTTYALDTGLMSSGLPHGAAVQAQVTLPDGTVIEKTIHAGDPSLYVPLRLPEGTAEGPAQVSFTNASTHTVHLNSAWVELGGPDYAQRFEAEPNDSPAQANPLAIGTLVEGSVDDVDYLDNLDEGKTGLDWFRIDITDEEPCLVIFELDVPDRDVSVNMRVYTLDPANPGEPIPYLEGKDPMEIVHDRERERYSKSITRTFTKGTYYLEVNANHPRYMIRSYKYPVPPYSDPQLAVEVGLRYIMDVGDAWFAQVPREGNIYRRVQNMHETAMRCTACHPAVFSTEANLVAHRNGYPIQSKANFRYVVERIYNSITPFYGPDDLYWQRFIAIPLQSQGKQGGILADFERQISGRETDVVERFGPLMRAAWIDREVLPDDEQNGVVPLDSKFGFAWRDWRMMQECYRRTGDESYKQAADNLEAIFASPEAETRIETLQDKIHLFLGLAYMNTEKYADRIHAIREELLALQNPDGGWDEEGKQDGTSAEYTTGQMVYSLIESGLTPQDEPRLENAAQFLLSRQKAFGGWFQTDTHENFRTPMRESRYALMALASVYPKGAPLSGLGNVNGQMASIPSAGASAADAIDALENIWEVAPENIDSIVTATLPMLERSEAPVRAAAASLLGRVGGEESVAPLMGLLDDPSKLVWREAAWGLRQLGNKGYGADALQIALNSADPLVRRSAARAFAYQFQGMDTRLDIAETFVELASDPDELTRLQALRTLRQWWYRTESPEFKSRIIDTYIARMGVDGETPALRTNLAQNMYILLDENQSGGVSMQRNIRDLPEAVGKGVLDGRIAIEQRILLEPVLTALAKGNDLQREALLESFDGSFFKGRYYARVPRDMIDVGNDREFSFMFTPEQSYLDATLGTLIYSEDRPAQLRRGFQLASFFEMPNHTPSRDLQLALFNGMFAEQPDLRATAREVVQRDLVLRATQEPDVASRVLELLAEPDRETRAIVLASIARSPEALANQAIVDRVQTLAEETLTADEPSAGLLPLVETAALDDRQAIAVLTSAWSALEERPASERIRVVNAITAREGIVGPREAAIENLDAAEQQLSRRGIRLLERAATDRDVAVREKVFEILPELEVLRRSKRAASILYAGLSDDSPAIRAKSLALARENDRVWGEEDVHEYVLKLLIAADPKTREAALTTVVERNLIATEPRYAARVKAVMDGDIDLQVRAEEALRAAGLDPDSITADAEIAAVRLPDILVYRDRVNTYFYEKGADKNACADCHATHTILGLAEPPKDGRPLSDDEIVANYRSMLKVINTSDPEQSLVLRKPRSPFGTGQSSKESPTGVTHVGGTRWEEDTANEAYQAILAFVRTARTDEQPIQRTASTDSYSPEYPPDFAIDGNSSTLWHTEFVGAMPGYPHELVVALDAPQQIAGLTYVPRQDSTNGRVKEFEVYVSQDGEQWGEPVASGVWANDAVPKTAFFPTQTARYVKLLGKSEVDGQPIMSAAEVEVLIDHADAKPGA